MINTCTNLNELELQLTVGDDCVETYIIRQMKIMYLKYSTPCQNIYYRQLRSRYVVAKVGSFGEEM